MQDKPIQLDSSDVEPSFLYSKLNSEDIQQSQNMKIHVVYDLITFADSQYGFNQSFCNNEANLYFECMHFFSKKTINEIVDSSDRGKYHFYTSKIIGNLKNALAAIGFDNQSGNDEPLIYHFALDEHCDCIASRSTGNRNPRMYFVVGSRGAIHPLFFDPFHELNPILAKTNNVATTKQNDEKKVLLKKLKKSLNGR